MATKYNQKQGLKRFTTPKRYGACKQAKKIIHIEETSPSPSLREDSYDRRSSSLASEGEEEELVPKERSTYDHLLRTLGSCSQSLANIYKRRQREEKGKSESESEEDDGNELEDDVDGGSESCSISEEENDYEDGNNHAMESKLHDLGMLGDVEPNEDAESKDDKEAFDTDQEQDFIVNGQSAIDAQDGTSSFYDHLEHKLLEGEVDNLTKRKCKYRWEKPAHFMSNCKWMGAGDCFLKDDNCDSDYGLKPKLSKHWLDVYEKSGGKDFHSSKQRLFFSLCNSYRDILHYNKKPFYLKGLEEDSSIMDAYIIHSLNHVFKTRDLVIKNDAKLAKQQDISKGDILAGEDFLDHGFTRPKVLILLPFASFALRVVKRLIQLTPSSYKTNVEYMDRFCDEFGTERAEDSGDHHVFEKQSSKPSDFQALFGGNNNDHFMIGIKFTRRCIKLYSDFYSSDMIIASPLGLVTKIGEAEKEKEKDTDYLSSIEVLIIDHADVIAMQNWSHVITAVEQLNRLPSKQHGTNVMRIRQCAAEQNDHAGWGPSSNKSESENAPGSKLPPEAGFGRFFIKKMEGCKDKQFNARWLEFQKSGQSARFALQNSLVGGVWKEVHHGLMMVVWFSIRLKGLFLSFHKESRYTGCDRGRRLKFWSSVGWKDKRFIVFIPGAQRAMVGEPSPSDEA
ncbi:protein NUCLEOLAR FACTOR 1-like [Malania oleifera]|uniref:protein NUCLEOLAR FACTOR 1-like n=1 Tax=Malania oleifera TaxID=397392 RepID=UPI0025ADD3F9|nr:protein NUCLEOLAR FACTOR 1-like [Malania oleifera]